MRTRTGMPLVSAAILLIPVAPVAAQGSDQILRCLGRAATIVGTPGPDTIVGTVNSDVIVTLGGKDDIRARAGDDVVCAGAGDDRALGGRGDDWLIGRGGADILFGEAGDDVHRGQDGRDGIYGGAGSDLVSGGDGDDHSSGGKGADVVMAGAGDDQTIEEGVGNIVRLGPGDDSEEGLAVRSEVYGGRGTDHILSVEHVIDGGPGDDFIQSPIPASSDPTIARSYSGGGGDDEFYLLEMWPDARTIDLDGGTGLDVVEFTPPDTLPHPDSAVYAFSMGPDGAWSQPYTGAFENVEQFYSPIGTYHITGSDGPDWIDVPSEEASTMSGLGGDDHLEGAGAPGSIDGGDGVDSCTNAVEQLNCEADL